MSAESFALDEAQIIVLQIGGESLVFAWTQVVKCSVPGQMRMPSRSEPAKCAVAQSSAQSMSFQV
jgi:hypothetical protein